MQTWLKSSAMPPLTGSGDAQTLEVAQRKRAAVVEWINLELKKRLIETRRGLPASVARFHLLKKFATNIRTSRNMFEAKFWADNWTTTPEDIFCMYVAKRHARRAEKN